MLNFGALAFSEPFVLAALALLPALWTLLRLIPPAPKRTPFPPVRLLLALKSDDQTAAAAPPWLILLRLALAAFLILALAHPLYNPGGPLGGSGPLVIVVDDGWTAAPRWQRRIEALDDLLRQAEISGRNVRLITTAPVRARPGESLDDPTGMGLMAASEARRLAGALQPKPWAVDRGRALEALEKAEFSGPVQTVWLSDGSDDGRARELARQLQRIGPLRVFTEPAAEAALALFLEADGLQLTATVVRATPERAVSDEIAGASAPRTVQLRATGPNGRLLSRVEARFEPGHARAKAEIILPLALRNELERIEIEGQAGAGSIVLMDERWRRRPVGLVTGTGSENPEPLLSGLHYLEAALKPFAEARRGSVPELLDRPLAVMVLTDVGRLGGPDRDALDDWIEGGGVLIRFAGPRLAAPRFSGEPDTLVPVRLRSGTRALGGALSWDEPAALATFEAGSPFHGLEVPQEITVTRQVLAEPALDITGKTWARLADGTPLVTAEQRGEGWIVLFHTTAGPAWTNLPFSGLFAQMLQRLAGLSQGIAARTGNRVLPPLATLDGFGRLGGAPASALPLNSTAFTDASQARPRVGPSHPPGIYGAEGVRHALNIASPETVLSPLPALPYGVERVPYSGDSALDLKPWLLALVIVLALADTLASLVLRGHVVLPGRLGTTAMLLLLVAMSPWPVGAAEVQNKDAFALLATLDTRLAYVMTGDSKVDDMSRAGLRGLTRVLAERTSVEPAEPLGINVERDELAFFPLLYWPMRPGQPALSETALARVDHYLRNGGTVLFDTRDGGPMAPETTRETAPAASAKSERGGTQTLRRLLANLDVPPLEPIDPDHVLTRSFYLIQTFPGRWTTGDLWIESDTGAGHEKVASVIIGNHDWAAAWAIDEQGRPLAALVPGGSRQRELAFRFGVNLMMYALTGNYKDDQVHLPALLERLGN